MGDLSESAKSHSRAERRIGVAGIGNVSGDAAMEPALNRLLASEMDVGTTGTTRVSSMPSPAHGNFDFYRTPCTSEMGLFLAACDAL